MNANGYSSRYGARDPWLAPWPRTALYLAWRALIASVRPVLFLALAAASIALAAAGLSERQGGPRSAPLSAASNAATYADAIDIRLRAVLPAGAPAARHLGRGDRQGAGRRPVAHAGPGVG